MRLTVIIIVYNERNTIQRAVEEVRKLDVDKEVIVVDNCSTDGTREVLESLPYRDIRIIYQPRNLGAGNSIQTGIEIARGEYISIQHSDLEYDHARCLDMMKVAESEGCDAVFGSRIKDALEKGKKGRLALLREYPPFAATFLTTFLVNLFYGYRFTDIIGTKFYRTASVRRISRCSNHNGFEFEHVSKMCKSGFAIREINIGYKPRENPKEKKIKFYHLFNALAAMFKVKLFYRPPSGR